jgi:hypothetical protein
MGKRVSTRRIKKNRHYTYDSAGMALGITSSTVRSWVKGGLCAMTDGKPHYILGEALIEFLDRRLPKSAGPMPIDQMYCLPCRSRKAPLGGMVDYIPVTDNRGRLVGLCESCERPIHRFVSKSDLLGFSKIFEVAMGGNPQA